MFKLICLFALVAVAAAKPGLLHAPAVAVAQPAVIETRAVLGETTVETHGNSVVHASAPVVSYSPPVLKAVVQPTTLVKTLAPVPVPHASLYAAPALAYPGLSHPLLASHPLAYAAQPLAYHGW